MPNEITFGSRVTACDCLLPGRVSMVWRTPSLTGVGDAPGRGSAGRSTDEGQQGKTNSSSVPTSVLRPPTSAVYFRVQFPPRSPFVGDWAVYRHGEIALLIEQPKLTKTNINVVNLMRPKFPRFQT